MKKIVLTYFLGGLLAAPVLAADKYTEQEHLDYIHTTIGISRNYAAERVGFDALLHVPTLAQHDSIFVVRPNNDTLYSMGSFDISEGHLEIQMPDTDRYLSVMLYDEDHYIATNGVLVNEIEEIIVVKVGNPVPDIEGTVITVETDSVGPVFRTLVRETDDLADARAVQQSISVVKVGGSETRTEPYPFLMSEEKYAEMQAYYAESERTNEFDWTSMYRYRDNPTSIREIAQGVYEGAGALTPDEAQYFSIFTDTDGNTLHGSKEYTLHVPAEMPVRHFWSVTAYDTEGNLMAVDSRVYNANSEATVANADGSTTIHFGTCDGSQANCIPTTDDEFNYLWRYYGPTGPLVDGTWKHLQPELIK